MATEVESFLWPIHKSQAKKGSWKSEWVGRFGQNFLDNAVTMSSRRNAICFCPNFWTCLNCQFRSQFCGLHAKRNDHFSPKANHIFSGCVLRIFRASFLIFELKQWALIFFMQPGESFDLTREESAKSSTHIFLWDLTSHDLLWPAFLLDPDSNFQLLWLFSLLRNSSH